ncbi:MAG: SdrD B-like domain-containing protein [Ferruginibacter sp.]
MRVKLLFITFLLLIFGGVTQAQVSGTVFRDFNANGAKDNGAGFNEPFVAGVTVKAFNSANIQLGTTKTTNASGAYNFTGLEIPSGTVVRVEFSGLAIGDFASANGTTNGTNVQFVTAPSNAVHFGVNAPEDFWNNTVNTDPALLAVNIRRGTTSSVFSGQYSVIHVNNSSSGPGANPANSSVMTVDTSRRPSLFSQTGTLFGMASQRRQERVFATSFLRRQSGLGPLGAGGVYILDKAGASWNYSAGFTLQGVTPSNGGAALDFGSITRVTGIANQANDNYISDEWSWGAPEGGGSDGRDMDAFGKATTMSYGDIEADVNSNKLFTVNLFQKRLIVFDASAASTVLNNASAVTLAPFTTAYTITSLPGCPAPVGAGNNIRPFGVKIYRGKGYLGVVSDAMSTQSKADLVGYILQFDPNNIAAGFTTVLTINFNSYQGNYWNPWAATWAQAGGTATSGPRDYAEPVIAGIEFNEDGSMDIGIRDRWGDQGGNFERHPVSGSLSHTQTSINGDLLHACWNGTAWTLEGTAGSCPHPAANTNAGTNTNNFGAGFSYGSPATAREWYSDRSGDGGNENNQGGMAKLMGSGIIASSIYDPMASGGNTAAVDGGGNGVYWSTQGLQWNNVSTGLKDHVARIVDGNSGSLDKSNAMGDIEFLLVPQPVQVGNRVWNDLNGNGIQDAGEPGIGGLTITLRSPGVNGIYGDGDDQTWTTTTDATVGPTLGNYYFSSLSSSDNRKPATWTGVGNSVLPGYDYRAELTIPAGYRLSVNDAGSNTVDNIDNDATQTGGSAYIIFNTNNTTHNIDFGFTQLGSLGNRVWSDDGAGGGTAGNGLQDGAEPGVAGITVSLYRNGTDGIAGTSDDVLVGTTITDAYGIYQFTNLALTDLTNGTTIAQTSYNIKVTAPSNYVFTTQTNTTDDNNTSGISTTGSDVNVLGVSYGIQITAGENNPNIDAGLVLRAAVIPNSIGDKVWFDTDGSGTQNGSEPGIAGVTVTLYAADGSTIIAITTTDANGNYLFNNVPANTNFVIGFSAPQGTLLTSSTGTTTLSSSVNSDPDPLTGKTAVFSSGSAGTQITGIDAGIVNNSNGFLGDYVWNDLNHNGVQDAGEPGIYNVSMQLYSPGVDGLIGGGDDVLMGTTTTGANGVYNFGNLAAGTYFVVATVPSGYTVSAQDAANTAGDIKDSDFGAGSGSYALNYVSGIYTLNTSAGSVSRDTRIDLGLYNSTANLNSIGDKVWNDLNGNGLQDGGEPGVANISVALLSNLGLPVINPASGKPYVVVTDAAGNYQFADVPDGSYMVLFGNIPAGYSVTVQDASGSGGPGSGTDGANDSDVKPTTGMTGLINVDAAGTNPVSVNIINVDAGIVQGQAAGTGSLGNSVWYDVNNNGVRDAGEPGVSNVRVELLDGAGNPVDSDPLTAGVQPYIVYTNGLGEYLFTGLPAGDYTVRFSNLPAGYTSSPLNAGSNDETDSDAGFAGTSTGATTATTAVYTLQSGQDNLSVDMGIVPATGSNSVGNIVWNDTNQNGIQDAGEPGVQGVTVSLYTNGGDGLPGTADDVFVRVTTTDEFGRYLFAGLGDGNYNIGYTNIPAGYSFTAKDAAGSTASDGSDPNQATGRTVTIGLDPTSASAASVNNTDVDAGIFTTRASLGNYVWNDVNGDGIQDSGEPGIAGVTVTLYAADGVTVLGTTITGAGGNYLFSNLTAGSYVVGFSTLPSGLQFTQQNTAGDNGNNTNSDANPSTGKTVVITLSNGENDMTIDAGIRKPQTGAVGNYVWNDVDQDGVQDVDEPGLPGILVTLYDAANNVVGTAVTDGNGNYLISNVAVGSGYYIIFSNLPSGSSFTTQSADVSAGDVTLGSDANVSTGQTPAFTITALQTLTTVDAGVRNLSTVPVKRLEATVVLSGNTSAVKWLTENEINTDHFEVERSTDGRRYTTVGTQAAAGDYAGIRNYELLDDVQGLSGVVYYRVKLLNQDARVNYSNVVTIRIAATAEVTVAPNPFVEKLNISIHSSKTEMVSVMLLDAGGRRVKQLSRKLYAGNNWFTVEGLGNLAKGIYTVRIIAANGTEILLKELMK